MKIYFKKNWGQFIDYKNLDEDDNYIGREEQIEHLKNTIINNDSGSILVSGERGTGKTAFIYKTIKEIKKENDKIIPILVNVNQIYENGEKLNNELLLKNLIKRLYSELKGRNFSDTIRKKVESLYKKVVGEYLLEEKNINKDVDTEELKNETTESIETNISKKEISKILLLFGITLGSFNLISEYIINFISTLQGIYFYGSFFGILIIFGIIIIFLFTRISIEHIYKKVEISNKINTKEVSEIYKKDNSIGSLEFDLNELLDELNNDYIILFVIDELDKITGNGEDISNLIKMYKNLFTLSKANFIFITDQRFYLDLINRNKTVDEHPTLFTFKYYLDYPSFDDLRNYLSHLIEKADNEDEKNIFINYLLFISNNDFFKLKEIIHSLLKYENSKGFIDFDKIKKRDKYINEKIKLYNLFEEIYNKYKSFNISLYHNNYKDLKQLFDSLGNNFNKSIYSLKEEEHGDLLSYIITLLQRYNIIKDVEGVYHWTGNSNRLLLINSLGHKTKEEKIFINKFLRYIELISRIDNIGNYFKEYEEWKDEKYVEIVPGGEGENLTGYIGALDLFNKYNDDYVLLNKGLSDNFIAIDDLKENIRDLNNHITNLENKYYQVFINIFKNIYNDFTHTGVNNGIITDINLKKRFMKFKGSFFYLNNIKVIILNNFNEVDNITNEEIKFLSDNSYILVNIYDENFKEIKGLNYYIDKKTTNKFGKIFSRKINYKFKDIVNIKFNLKLKNLAENDFESFYFGVKEINNLIIKKHNI